MLSPPSCQDKTVNARLNTWFDKTRQNQDLQSMQRRTLKNKISVLSIEADTLRNNEKKIQARVNRLENNKMRKYNNENKELHLLRQRKKELVSCQLTQ